MNSVENTNKDYFECFSFGDSPEMADELLALVLSGKKTATVSVFLEGEQTPNIGVYHWFSTGTTIRPV